MITKKTNEQLNKQVQLEGQSSHVYLAMAGWADEQGYSGISKFLYHHSDEERLHMLKLFHFIIERGGKAAVPDLKVTGKSYSSVQQIFESVLEHEVFVTGEINKLVDHCLKEKDYTTHNFLQWYVTEQLEEERLARNILDKLKLIGTDKGGMYLFDRDLQSLAAAESKGGNGGE